MGSQQLQVASFSFVTVQNQNPVLWPYTSLNWPLNLLHGCPWGMPFDVFVFHNISSWSCQLYYLPFCGIPFVTIMSSQLMFLHGVASCCRNTFAKVVQLTALFSHSMYTKHFIQIILERSRVYNNGSVQSLFLLQTRSRVNVHFFVAQLLLPSQNLKVILDSFTHNFSS